MGPETQEAKLLHAVGLLRKVADDYDIGRALALLEPVAAQVEAEAHARVNGDAIHERREAAQRKAAANRKAELIRRLESPHLSSGEHIARYRAALWPLLTDEERAEWLDREEADRAERAQRRTVGDVTRSSR